MWNCILSSIYLLEQLAFGCSMAVLLEYIDLSQCPMIWQARIFSMALEFCPLCQHCFQAPITGVLSLLATQKPKSKRCKTLDGFFNWPKNVVLQSILVMVTVNNYHNGRNACFYLVNKHEAIPRSTLFALQCCKK